jgi:hypothetical protein
MDLDTIIGILIGVFLILVILLTLPVWICYTIYKKWNWQFIKKVYIMWLEK